MIRRTMPALVLVLALALAACGGSGGIEVTDAWGRSSPSVADTAAFYVTFENHEATADRLVGVAAAGRCETAELHRSEMVEGVMRMRPADPEDLAIGANGSLVMEPGGLHVMCIGLRSALVQGDEIPLTFEFAQAGSVEVLATIEDR